MPILHVLQVKQLRKLVEAIEKAGYEPIVICRSYGGGIMIREPFEKTPENYARLITDCKEAWIGVKVW